LWRKLKEKNKLKDVDIDGRWRVGCESVDWIKLSWWLVVRGS
jgi:hypothetical protein